MNNLEFEQYCLSLIEQPLEFKYRYDDLTDEQDDAIISYIYNFLIPVVKHTIKSGVKVNMDFDTLPIIAKHELLNFREKYDRT